MFTPNKIIIAMSTAFLVACNDTSSDKTAAPELNTLDQKASYSFGMDIAGNLIKQGVTLETEQFIQGIRDASMGNQPLLDEAARNDAKTAYQTALRDRLLAEQNAAADKNKTDGEAFLAENAKKEGVVTTASGLQYKVITEGTGKSPTASDTVVTHYRGKLIDGREFDSSYKRNQPATFPVGGVIKGWTEALQLMKEGAKWELYVPSELAYGNRKASELIQPNSTLTFEVELIEVK